MTTKNKLRSGEVLNDIDYHLMSISVGSESTTLNLS